LAATQAYLLPFERLRRHYRPVLVGVSVVLDVVDVRHCEGGIHGRFQHLAQVHQSLDLMQPDERENRQQVVLF
jgi:hypothetical protein